MAWNSSAVPGLRQASSSGDGSAAAPAAEAVELPLHRIVDRYAGRGHLSRRREGGDQVLGAGGRGRREPHTAFGTGRIEDAELADSLMTVGAGPGLQLKFGTVGPVPPSPLEQAATAASKTTTATRGDARTSRVRLRGHVLGQGMGCKIRRHNGF